MTDREAIDVLFNEWKCIDRNDGIHCDRKCEHCDLVMDVGIIREAFNMAISALQAQDSHKPTAGSVQNVQNEDLISRKAAIDALWEIRQEEISDGRRFHNHCSLSTAVDVIKDLPSAQPEPCKDAVSRADVVDMLEMFPFTEYSEYETAREVVKRLPSAQTEIVMCKDCKYCDRGIDEDGNPFLKCLGWVYGGTQEEDFCSHAERRTDEANDIT